MKYKRNFLAIILFLVSCTPQAITDQPSITPLPVPPQLAPTALQAITGQPTAILQTVPSQHTPTPVVFPTGNSYPLMTGFIPGDPTAQFMKQVDEWAGKRHSIVGLFYDFDGPGNPSQDFENKLEEFWQAGYTSFAKIMVMQSCKDQKCGKFTSAQIANGAIDDKITLFAQAYKNFINKGGGRKAFIAPLQEMNGYWVSYGQNPQDFKKAYDRIQNIFQNVVGIQRDSIWWAFAPNGWPDNLNDPNLFEYYYPGDSKVDVISFAAYNYGYCLDPFWKTPQQIYSQYLQRLRNMAPSKPIVISETASSDFNKPGSQSKTAKNEWLISAYSYLATEKSVIAILYFDIEAVEHNKNCNLRVYNYPDPAERNDGYVSAVRNPSYSYVAPELLSTLNLVIH